MVFQLQKGAAWRINIYYIYKKKESEVGSAKLEQNISSLYQ